MAMFRYAGQGVLALYPAAFFTGYSTGRKNGRAVYLLAWIKALAITSLVQGAVVGLYWASATSHICSEERILKQSLGQSHFNHLESVPRWLGNRKRQT